MDILTVKNLTKEFAVNKKKVTAVDSLSFSLKEGEILGMLGPNGAGKTTTIQMLLGALTPTSGRIEFFGKEFNAHREEILEEVNFSSTYTDFPWTLTVKENLVFFSYLYNIKDRNKRVKKIIETFSLNEFIDSQIQDLSAGQRTRVNLAKAFLNYPKVLLLDEPTASLDPDVAQYIRDFLLHEQKQFNVSIIITSHNMAEVEEVCDRVIFINKGKIMADDTPENLARSVKIAHVELMVRDGLKRLIEYCDKRKQPYRLEGRYIIVDVGEEVIPIFLREVMDRGVVYDSISIDKPTLQDFFLEVAKKKTAPTKP